MFVKRGIAALAPVIVALAVGVPAASSAPAIPDPPGPQPVITGPSCPAGYNGPTNLATGCPFWMMTYTVEYPAG